MITIHKETTCLVFRTSLQNKEEVNRISEAMDNIPGVTTWSVDLNNWENVLRVEGDEIRPKQIILLLRSLGVEIQEMPV